MVIFKNKGVFQCKLPGQTQVVPFFQPNIIVRDQSDGIFVQLIGEQKALFQQKISDLTITSTENLSIEMFFPSLKIVFIRNLRSLQLDMNLAQEYECRIRKIIHSLEYLELIVMHPKVEI